MSPRARVSVGNRGRSLLDLFDGELTRSSARTLGGLSPRPCRCGSSASAANWWATATRVLRPRTIPGKLTSFVWRGNIAPCRDAMELQADRSTPAAVISTATHAR